MKKLEGNYLFTGVVSVTLNFHPQGRNVNVVTNEGEKLKSWRPGGSGVRADKSLIPPDRVTGAARPPTFQLFPSLVTSFTFLPWG